MPATEQRHKPGVAVERRGARPRPTGFFTARLAVLLAVWFVGLRLAYPHSVSMPAAGKLQPNNPTVAVERSDAPPRLFGFLAAGLVAMLAVSVVALRLIYPGSLSGPTDAPRQATAQPALQINPAADLAAHRAAAAKELAGYGWVDRAHGVIRMPIEQAMRDIAKAGIPDWPKDAK